MKDINSTFDESDYYETVDELRYEFDINRRDFIQVLGAGLLITIAGGFPHSDAQAEPLQRRAGLMSERLHIGADGIITVMTGKIEMGQGARTQLTMVSAEELRVPVENIRMIMGDTGLTPNDGGTAGSRTTPSTVPVIRNACAAAREILINLAAETWKANRSSLEARDGKVVNSASNQEISYGELAKTEKYSSAFEKPVESGISVTPVNEWKIMGRSPKKIGGADIVTGSHQYPSDITRPGMLYGKALQPASYGAVLISADTNPAEAMNGVTVVRNGNFIGVAAQTSHQAEQALKAIENTAKWDTAPHPSSSEIYSYLKEHSSSGGGRSRGRNAQNEEAVQKALEESDRTFSESYRIAYIQHAPLEPRAAVAEWNDGSLTVWTGTQQPRRVHSELARAFNIPSEKVRVILPDMGSGFGGKHSGEVAVQAARIAKETGRPVSVRWSREEEFTWAYFRPAGLIEIQAGLDKNGSITAWNFINYNSGSSAIATPYKIPAVNTQYKRSESPLRQGSYRALASTANNFARESFFDELAHAAGIDPLDFRLEYLDNERIRNVLISASTEFDWKNRTKKNTSNKGVGLACGTEKGSVVAACVEVEVDLDASVIKVLEVCEAFECEKIINPENTISQVTGCIIMGMGGALSEEIRFENGKVLNPNFSTYRVPRFKDVPKLNIILDDRPISSSVGAGETPIIAIAPAIANAVYAITGKRIRSMPIMLNT